MPDDKPLRDQLAATLKGGHAHASLDQAIDDFPKDQAGIRPAGLPHSGWELLEHLRIAQRDILEFSRSKQGYLELKFPDDYWPKSPAPAKDDDWDQSVQSFRADLDAFEQLIQDSKRDLNAPFPWGDGQTLLREALLLIDHNSYHLGQLVLVRRALGSWTA